MGAYKFKAFISYSHKDRAWAKWLLRRIESYSFPKHLIGSGTSSGIVPKNLKPVFRDREELSVGHNLGEKIEAALNASENLIIICSPNSAKSHWVNQEIIHFKRYNRDANILSVIIDGEPFSTNHELECFPPALKVGIDENGVETQEPAEPLAADFRAGGDGKRLGVLKLISGMVGLGVNDLIQRDLQRAKRRVMAITASAAAIVLAMGGLTLTAIDARNEAQQRRNDAEGQIEFMLTDLKDKLKGVGRLDALEIVGERAKEYYDQYPISEHDDDALGRKARVFHYLGEILDQTGSMAEAENYFEQAYEITTAQLEKDPNNPDRIFEHAQSVYWIARIPWINEEYKKVIPYYEMYLELAERLKIAESGSARSLIEIAYAYTNLGSVYIHVGDLDAARKYIEDALTGFQDLIELAPKNVTYQHDHANALAWLSDFYASEKNYEKSIEFRVEATEKYYNLSSDYPKNYNFKYELLVSNRSLARLYFLSEDLQAAEKNLIAAEKISLALVLREPENSIWQNEIKKLDELKEEIDRSKDLKEEDLNWRE